MKNEIEFDLSNKNEKKKLFSFLNQLIEYNLDEENHDYYFDIRLSLDDCKIITLQFVQTQFNETYKEEFVFKKEDEFLAKQFMFPDNSSILISTLDNEEEILKNWLDEHPGWSKDCYGNWKYKEKDND